MPLMKKLTFALCVALLAMAGTASASQAQSNDRMDRLERDLQMMQKHVYRGGASAPAGVSPAGLDRENAQSSVRFTEINERLRYLEGRVETLEFENRKLKEAAERQQKDIEMRLGDLERGQGGSVMTGGDDVPSPTAEAAAEAGQPPLPIPTETGKLSPNKAAADGKKFASSREHYDYAFNLLQQTQYDEARLSFESFIQNYPKDPLLGNAYYWAGQTYFVKQNYVQAADLFRQGFETRPDGPKAGDNLLKLARSLAAIDRKSEACVVLKQVAGKFGKNSAELKQQAEQERARVGCS